ncbi:LytTR family transcriptional regulator [Chryseobacterium phosphatilyticum]|uniref:LytTR family transcriptional regulator n=1 Tax=Chryseobacterium phosphatilyticum TaxID=475075 RepID=A0A316X703_9FLAO|nr:LytTR family DNA-binding domain-containing protein [Chryseobacterium phosphatilyticum]PWN68556.1 LytTR family transcriptional regulator [Chryseobacterium phosphatilyticum]
MKYIVFFLLMLSIDLYGQHSDDRHYSLIVKDINNYEFQKATGKIRNLTNDEARNLFQHEVDYLKAGLISNQILSLDNSGFNYYLKGIYYAYLGDYYSRVSKSFNEKSYQLYLKTYQLGVQHHDISLQQEGIRRILHQFQVNEMNFIQFSEYSDKYLQLENDFINSFWAKYYSAFKRYYEETEFKRKRGFTIKSYDSLLVYGKQKPFLKGRAYQLMGIYYNVIRNYSESKKCMANAKSEYKKSPDFYSQLALHRIEFNEGFYYLDTQEPEKAAAIFKRSEQSSYFKKDIKSNILISDALYKTYSKIKNSDSALYYFNRRTAFEDTLKREENALAIHEIDTKYQVQQKNQTISYQKESLKTNRKYRFLYFILAVMALLLALYSLIRWKKVDMKKQKLAQEKESLQVEHSQTILELEKVKQLIVEDHIVLKNKAKVYINELLYIKAEDHYLQLVTSKKKEFVRGKISEIIKELPPNFVQVHRSYIVNKNLIISSNANFAILEGKIEIPLSRSFKKNI